MPSSGMLGEGLPELGVELYRTYATVRRSLVASRCVQ